MLPRVHFMIHMFISVPPAAIGGENPTGWSNEEPFIDYLKHFTSCPCLVRKTQLILFIYSFIYSFIHIP